MEETIKARKTRNNGAKKTPSFEERLSQIEGISVKLQESETSLDEAVSLYEQGMKIARELEKELSEYERRVEIISEPYNEEDDYNGSYGEDSDETESEESHPLF